MFAELSEEIGGIVSTATNVLCRFIMKCHSNYEETLILDGNRNNLNRDEIRKLH